LVAHGLADREQAAAEQRSAAVAYEHSLLPTPSSIRSPIVWQYSASGVE